MLARLVSSRVQRIAIATAAAMSLASGTALPQAPTPHRSGLTAASVLATEFLDDPIEPDGRTGQLKDGILELRGPIDNAMHERFDAAIATNSVTTVRITSQGGDIIHAIQMATVIQARGIDVVVHDLCLGACAQYIFVAGKKRRLENRSLVGFINSIRSSSTLLGMAIDTLQVRNPMEFVVENFASLEDGLYRSRGVAASLLLDLNMALQPQCVTLRHTANGGMFWNTSNTYILWVPTREYLQAAGVEFEGDWPKSNFQLGGLANRYLHIRNVRFVRFGDEDRLRPKKQAPYSLEQVRKCVLEEVPPNPVPAAG